MICSFYIDYIFRWWALFSYFFSWSWYARASCTKLLNKCFQIKRYHQRYTPLTLLTLDTVDTIYNVYTVDTIQTALNCLNSSIHAYIQSVFRCASISWISVEESSVIILKFCQILDISSGYVQGMFRVSSEFLQSFFRLSSDSLPTLIRLSSELPRSCLGDVQSLLAVNIVVIALSSASSVSVFGIFLTGPP